MIKKSTLFFLFVNLFLFSSLSGPFFPHFSHAADERVVVLEQDVIQAKKNYQTIENKSETVATTLEAEQAIVATPAAQQNGEAEQMLRELIRDTSKTKPENPRRWWHLVPSKEEYKSKRITHLAQLTKKNIDSGNLVKAIENTKQIIKLDPHNREAKAMLLELQKDKELKRIHYKTSKKDEPMPDDGELKYKVAISDEKITLKETVEIALANNLQIKANQKKIEVAEAKLTEARRALFPTAQMVAEWNGGIVAGRFYKGRNRKLNLTQPLFYGGELMLTVKQAHANLQSAKAELLKSRNEFIHQVKTAYYGVVKAEYNAQYQSSLFEEVRVLRQKSVEENKQKLIAEIDYLGTEAQYNQVFFQAEAAKSDYLSADLLLHQSVALSPEVAFPIDSKLTYNKIHPKPEEVIERAIENNPSVVIKEKALESAIYGVQIFKSKKMPKVDLRGSWGYLGEAHQDQEARLAEKAHIDTEKEWFLGVQTSMPLGPNSVEYTQVKHNYGPTVLSLHGSIDWSHKATLNLFDKLSDITDEKSAQATLLQADYDYKNAKNEVTIQVRDSFYNLQKSLIQIDSTNTKIRYQEKQNNILRYMISIQETTYENLLEGLIEQAQNKFAFIQAVVDYHLAVSNLNLAVGKADYFESETSEA